MTTAKWAGGCFSAYIEYALVAEGAVPSKSKVTWWSWHMELAHAVRTAHSASETNPCKYCVYHQLQLNSGLYTCNSVG
jgi:hypothetical protein